MLRHQLMVRLGVLVVGFVGGAIVSILLLHSLLGELDRVTERASAVNDEVRQLAGAVEALQAGVGASGAKPAAIAEEADRARRALAELESRGVTDRDPQARAAAGRLESNLAALAGPAGSDPGTAVVAAAGTMRHDVGDLAGSARRQAAAEQLAVSRHLRRLIIWLTIAALIMTNVAIVVLLKTGQMILRPVSALVEGSRLLARERFDHRVVVDQNDEFGELAHAYNRLAEQLQANERRRIETLHQMAVTLNHELNNVINIVELQLGLLDRRAVGDPALTAHLKQIRGAMKRMTQTVASLKDMRRIVLTEYTAGGEMMLDLPRCTAAAPEGSGAAGQGDAPA